MEFFTAVNNLALFQVMSTVVVVINIVMLAIFMWALVVTSLYFYDHIAMFACGCSRSMVKLGFVNQLMSFGTEMLGQFYLEINMFFGINFFFFYL